MRLLWIAMFLAGCGGSQPVLGNLPQPDPAVVAGVAALAAGAATLANPSAAGQKPEDQNAKSAAAKPQKSVRMPGDVLDRLDRSEDGPADSPDAGPR